MFPYGENATVVAIQDLPLDQRMRSDPTHAGQSVASVLVQPRRNSGIADASTEYSAVPSEKKDDIRYIDKLMDVFDVYLVASNSSDEVHKPQL